MTKRLIVVYIAFLSTLSVTWAGSADCADQASDVASKGAVITCARPEIFNTVSDGPGKKDKMKKDRNIIYQEHFRYQIEHPANPSGEIVVLLHGSGGDETTLFPLSRPIWPRATLIGVRGRIVQNGETRWYRKITPIRFDQKDIKRETDALVRFLTGIADEKQYDTSRITFVGYSNGANLLAVMMMEHPDLVRRAVLMRSMPVLDKMPAGDLRKARILTISGKDDVLYSPFAPALSSLLRMNGARVESHMIEENHMIGENDARIITRWVGNQNPDSISAISPQKQQDWKHKRQYSVLPDTALPSSAAACHYKNR